MTPSGHQVVDTGVRLRIWIRDWLGVGVFSFSFSFSFLLVIYSVEGIAIMRYSIHMAPVDWVARLFRITQIQVQLPEL